MKTFQFLVVSILGLLAIAASPQGYGDDNEMCQDNHGNFCRKIQNYCDGNVGSCARCDSTRRHDLCDGDPGMCEIQKVAGSDDCGYHETASCNGGLCENWTYVMIDADGDGEFDDKKPCKRWTCQITEPID